MNGSKKNCDTFGSHLPLSLRGARNFMFGRTGEMMKTIRRPLPFVLGVFLLLACASVSASAQDYLVQGQIRWRKEMGTVPMGPGHASAAIYPCSIFSVAALDAKTQKPVTYTDQVASPFRKTEEGDYYVCRYALKVPPDRNLYMIATMGGVLLLPKEDDAPYLITGPWIGGISPKPARGSQRGFTGQKFVNLRSRVTSKNVVWVVNFEMVYIRIDPN
jgi:hypothetical protein